LAREQEYYHLLDSEMPDDTGAPGMDRYLIKMKGANAFDAPIKPRPPWL
jgi:hypothetical protein